jgi:hypothetical protein
MFRKWLKILVTKQQLVAVLDIEHGNHAIQGFPFGVDYAANGDKHLRQVNPVLREGSVQHYGKLNFN